MTKALYFDCSAGMSGDMTVAALLDAGASEEALRTVLESVPVEGFSVQVTRVEKAGVNACDFDVVLDAAHENHDHDMAYLYGHEHEGEEPAHEHHHGHHHHDEDCDPSNEHCGCHDHEHGEGHHHHHHHHEHRGLAEVNAIIDGSAATDRAKEYAHRIFDIIAQAEAKAHETTIDQVHFHEVGAVDSIVDVLSIAVCYDNLGAPAVIIPRLCEGQGTVRCQHGVLPIPVPAVCNIIEAHDVPLEIIEVRGELVTPTGAAAATALCTSTQLPAQYAVERTGYGAGKRVYPETTGLLKVQLIEYAE